MASTPSKIPGPSKGRPVRESKLTAVSRVPHRDASGKRRSELASPKVEAVRKTRSTPPSSAASSQIPPGSSSSSSSVRQPASSSPSLDTKAKPKSVNVQGDYAELKKENASLKKELQELKSLHNQLLQEGPSESFVKKRVDLLKTQVVQLERQIVLLTQALSSRTELMVDVQVMLESLLGSLEENVKEEGKGEVLKLASTLNNRLMKHSQESSLDHLAVPLQFLEDFVQPKKSSSFVGGFGGDCDDEAGAKKTAVTVLDVCSGRTDHINLKQVNRLESKLMQLYGELTQLQSSLDVSQVGHTPSLLRPMEDRICRQATRSSKVVGECCQALLCFSLLVPSPPSPPLKGTERVKFEFSASSVLKKLPTAVRNKKEVREVVEAATTAMSHHSEMNEAKCRVLEEELQFHKAIYDLQISYIGSLFKAVRDGYETFEGSVQEILCSPLHELLEGYGRLSQTASDEALRDFLEIIQKNHEQLQQALDSFSKVQPSSEPTRSESPQGVEALSLYGQHFFEQLAELEAQCDHTRHRTLTNTASVVQDNASTVS